MTDRILESQDERLLSLEASLRDVAYKTGQIDAKQESLAKSIEDQSVLLAAKLDEGFNTLKTGQESLSVHQTHIEQRLKPIEEKHLRVEGRIQFVRKLAMPALVATAGVFGAKFGNELINAVIQWFR
jgi:hypothetical protein